jgi:hypothetical protein
MNLKYPNDKTATGLLKLYQPHNYYLINWGVFTILSGGIKKR